MGTTDKESEMACIDKNGLKIENISCFLLPFSPVLKKTHYPLWKDIQKTPHTELGTELLGQAVNKTTNTD